MSVQSGRPPLSSSSLSSSSAGDNPDLSGKNPDPFLCEAPIRVGEGGRGGLDVKMMQQLDGDAADERVAE